MQTEINHSLGLIWKGKEMKKLIEKLTSTKFWKKLQSLNWKMIWDKCTTGLLLLLMASPLLILGYIFIWFMTK